MNTLKDLLVILGSQQLSPGYLTPPKPTALETVIELKKQYDPYVLLQNPLPFPQLLMTPAFIGSLASGQDAIFLDDVSGNLDLSHGKQPAYTFSNFIPPGSGGGSGTSFNAGVTTQGSVAGSYVGITAEQITTPKSGLLQSLSIFCSNTGAGTQIMMGLYADNAGAPAALLASSAAGVSAASGIVTLPVTGGPTLPAGKYWVAVLGGTTFGGYLENTGGAGAYLGSVGWTGSMPSPFSPGFSTGPFLFSLYATFLG